MGIFSPDQLKRVQCLDCKKKYTKAEKDDPDGWTLLAFTNRKLTNFSKAEELYEKALKLEPNNKIALEYQGELFLALGQMEKALNNLRLLKSQCQLGCLEVTQLKAAIDKF